MQDPFVDQLRACADRSGIADRLLSKALDFTGAPKGNIQILDKKSGFLKIVAQRGFGQEFLEFFRDVNINEDSVCAHALKRREIATVGNVAQDPRLSRCLPIFERAQVRAVQSIPLISKGGELVGMVSTHFPHVIELGLPELLTMARFARLAADRLVEVEAQVWHEQIPLRRRLSWENRRTWLKLGFESRTKS